MNKMTFRDMMHAINNSSLTYFSDIKKKNVEASDAHCPEVRECWDVSVRRARAQKGLMTYALQRSEAKIVAGISFCFNSNVWQNGRMHMNQTCGKIKECI